MSEERAFTQTSFQAYLSEHQLMGSRCGSCNALHLPPRPMCPDCYGNFMMWEAVEGDGEIAAYTTVYIGPSAMIEAGYGRDNPYASAVVKLEAGPSISGQVVGVDPANADELAVGAKVKIAFIERDDRTFLGFEPI